MIKKRKFKVNVNQEVLIEIQDPIDFYNSKQSELGDRFFNEVKKRVKELSTDFNLYQIKYDDIRCCSVQNYPFLIHYRVEEKQKIVSIEAIIHMSRNPDQNWED